MNKAIHILLLFFLLLAPLGASAEKHIRARPILKGDKEINSILIHIASYFVLTLPEDKTADDIEYNVRCTFHISEDGRMQQLEVENDTDGWTRFFDGSISTSVDYWLKSAVLVGMRDVPPFDMTEISSRRNRKRVVVFSFGRGQRSSTNINSLGYNADAVRANTQRTVDEIRQELIERAKKGLDSTHTGPLYQDDIDRYYTFQTPKWQDFVQQNTKETSKLPFNPYTNAPQMKPPQTPSTGLPTERPPVQLSISLE